MPGALMAAEALEAAAAVDEVMAEAWQLLPRMAAPEVTAPPVSNDSRSSTLVVGTFQDPEAKPDLPNGYDRRQTRRPGESSGRADLRVSPAALAAVPGLTIRQNDLLVRQADGVTWRAASVFPMAGGTLRVALNLVG